MGKYVNYRVAGYWLYYTTSCKKEHIVHVHANKPTTEKEGSTKIWVHADGTSTVVQPTNIKAKDLQIIQDWIKNNMEIIASYWKENPKAKYKYNEIYTGDDAKVTNFFLE